MEMPQFLAGSEKKFSEFISKLNEKEKLALISHTDHDGIAAAKIANEVLQADFLYFKDYEDLTVSFVKELKDLKVKHLVLTDLSLTDPEFLKEAEKHFQILIIDHHRFSADLNSEKTTFLCSQGFCATYLCFYLFSKIQNLQNYDWLVASASIADWTYPNNQKFMSETMKKYGDIFEISNGAIRKSGKFWDMNVAISFSLVYLDGNEIKVYDVLSSDINSVKKIEQFALPVKEEINNSIKRFEKEKIPIKEGYFWEFSPKFSISSIVSTILSETEPNKKFIIARPKKDFYHLSIRRQDGKEDTCILMQSLVSGLDKGNAGGHIKASGGQVDIKEADKLRKRILALK